MTWAKIRTLGKTFNLLLFLYTYFLYKTKTRKGCALNNF